MRHLFLELWRIRNRYILLTLVLIVGWLSLFSVFKFSLSQDTFIQGQSRNILTSDLMIQSNQIIDENDLKNLRSYIKPTAETEEIELNSSLMIEGKAFLVELKGVNTGYPLYGQIPFELDKKNPIIMNSEIGPAPDEAWISKEILGDLQSRPQSLMIGQKEFKISRWIEADTGLLSGISGIAPRVYVHIESLKKTGLIQPGSQVRFRIHFATSSAITQNDLKDLQISPDLQIRTPTDTMESLKRGLKSIGIYLHLLTVFVFSFSFMSAFYIFIGLTKGRQLTFSILEISGLTKNKIIMTVWVQNFLIIVFTILLSLAVIFFVEPSVQEQLHTYFFGIQDSHLGSFAILCLGIGLMMSLAVTTPLSFQKKITGDGNLIQSGEDEVVSQKQRFELILLAFPFLLFAALAGILTKEPTIPIILSLSFLGFLVLSWKVISIVPHFALLLIRPTGFWRTVLVNSSQMRFTNTIFSMSISLIGFFLFLIPMTFLSIESEFKSSGSRPQLFLFNINEDALTDLEFWIKNKAASNSTPAPLILGRLLKINNQKTEGRLAQFPVRISYRSKLNEYESSYQGSWPAPIQAATDLNGASPIIGISIEKDFAERNKIKMNDILDFELAGIDFKTKVQNLRSVQWSSFQPNFFILFPENTLEDFPKSYLMSVSGIEPKLLYQFQNELVRQFSGLTAINIGQSLEKLILILETLALPLLSFTVFCFAITLCLTLMLVIFRAQGQLNERRIYRWLGMSSIKTIRLATIEITIQTGLSLFIGATIGTISSLALDFWLFEREFFLRTPNLSLTISGFLILLFLLIPYLFHRMINPTKSY